MSNRHGYIEYGLEGEKHFTAGDYKENIRNYLKNSTNGQLLEILERELYFI